MAETSYLNEGLILSTVVYNQNTDYDDIISKQPKITGGFTKNLMPSFQLSNEQKNEIKVFTNNRVFILSNKLKHIKDAISKSADLQNLKEDWDSDGATGVSQIVYDTAIELLLNYSKAVLDFSDIAIKAPEITAGRDGSIDLDWKTPNSELLITILNTPELNIHYYGDDGNGNKIIKGFLNNLSVDEDLSYWMRKL
jgi:hypothetical protein